VSRRLTALRVELLMEDLLFALGGPVAVIGANTAVNFWWVHEDSWSSAFHSALNTNFAMVPVSAAVLLLKALGSDRLARFSVGTLTNLAVLLAGSRRRELRDEWCAHLAGESGHDRATLRRNRKALGFVVSAVRFRLADAADLAWRPVDAVLGSRALSNLFVWGPVIVMLLAIVRHDGRFGLVSDIQDPIALGFFLFMVIKRGRKWRGIKLPEPKPRRSRE